MDIENSTFSDEKLHDFFKERVQFFFFNFTRKTNQSLKLLHSQFKYTLTILKNTLDFNHYSNQWNIYLELFYCMIGQTRDVVYGKGERELSYMLIFTFYDFFPSLTFYLVQRLVIPLFETNNFKLCYGSWRDIPALCDFIYRFTNHSEHPLIDYCVVMMNQQLIQDYEVWIHSTHKSKDIITNVAKWIPRENKQFDWLFQRLVVLWANIRHPHILSTVTNCVQFTKAKDKCKRLYRKHVSFLNKQLHTIECKMTSKQMDYLVDETIPIHHVCKHFSYYHTSQTTIQTQTSLLQKKCSLPNDLILPYYANHFSLAFFIQKARFYSQLSTKEIKKHKKEISNLNKLWTNNIQKIPSGHFDHIIPFVDVSSTMQKQSDLFYSAVALSIIIVQRSLSSQRILVMDTFPTWVHLDHKKDLISIVRFFFHTISSKQNTIPNFQNAVEMFQNGLVQSDFIQNMSLVFFSDFHQFVDSENDHGNKINKLYTQLSSFFKSPHIPYFVFWNLSNSNNISIPSHRDNDKVVFFSGTSMNLLGHLPFFKTVSHSYAFKTISNILFSIRYTSLSNYLYQFIQTNK